MNRLFKTFVLGAAVAATALSSLPQARAGEQWHGRHHDRVRIERRDDTGGLIAAGVVGLAVGALIASANQPPAYRESTYREPLYRDHVERPRPHRDWYPPAPAQSDVVYEDDYPSGYAADAEPWSTAWYDWCEARYRSFDPQTGTYRGHDGRGHFCIAD